MAAETVLICECGCGQNEHHIGKKGCKHCTRFRAAEELPAAVQAATAVDPPVVIAMTPTAVREVFDEAQAAAEILRLREVERERDSLAAHNEHLVNVSRERDDARGALAVARARVAELERALAAQIGRGDLATAQQEIEQLRAQLAAIPSEERVYSSYTAWQCETCGGRYRPNHDHPCGPLKPVRVTVTYRTEGPA